MREQTTRRASNPSLRLCRPLGFLDFDRMVAANYTASFEKSSVPGMTQRVRRGRRLAKMLRDVHERQQSVAALRGARVLRECQGKCE